MKQTTIDKIIRNAVENRIDTVIGKYTYRFNVNSGKISRCKTEDIGRMWIDAEGNRSDAWVVVAQIHQRLRQGEAAGASGEARRRRGGHQGRRCHRD